MKSISVLGCGWLGFPLAEKLIEEGFSIKGSTTSSSKLESIEKLGVKPFLIKIHEDKINGDIISFLENVNYLIIDIPPKLRGSTSENFVHKIKNLIPYVEQSTVKKVLFISSTSVYNDENKTVTEETTLNPISENGQQLLEVEQLLSANKHFQTTILRFGGLIGFDRNPVHFLSGKKMLENPEAPINLIHQNDCIAIILNIISKEVWNETFNAVAPFHPNRKTYYTKKAEKLELELPSFDESKPSIGKTVSSEKLMRFLSYTFKKID